MVDLSRHVTLTLMFLLGSMLQQFCTPLEMI